LEASTDVQMTDGRRRFAGKVIVVTGSASGIGLTTARQLAQEGASLALGDINDADGQRTADELNTQATFTRTDVSESAQMRRLIDGAVAHYGKLDAIFNNAGISLVGSILDRSEEDFDRVVAVNLRGAYLGCKHALPHLLANPDGGVILNMSSNGGLIGRPDDPLYNATKHGIMGLTKSLALAYADQRVRVNAVCPGPIETPMMWREQRAGTDRDTHIRRAVASCPTPRTGQLHEVAQAALFLLSSDSSFITGVGLPVDGGKAAGTFKPERYRLDFDLL